jgi:hypothetical protein
MPQVPEVAPLATFSLPLRGITLLSRARSYDCGSAFSFLQFDRHRLK